MALWDTAETELYEGKFNIGWPHITKARDILERIINQTDDSLTWARYCDIVFSMGYNLQVQNKMDSCFPYLMKSMQLTTDHFGPEHFINTMCLNKLSNYYEYIGDMKKEREALFKSFYIRRKILDSNDLFVAYAYMNMAGYYYNLGDLTKANMYNSRIEAIMQYHYEIYKQNKFDNSSKGILKYYSTFGWTPKTRNLFLLSIPRFYLATQFTLCEANLIAGNTDRAMFYYHNAQNYVANNPQVTVNISSRLSYMTAFKLVLENELAKGNIILDSLIILNAGDGKHKPNYLNLVGALDLKAVALEKMGKTSEVYNTMRRCYEIGKIDFEYNNQFYFSCHLEELSNKLGFYEESLRLVDTSLRKIMKKNVTASNLLDSIDWNDYTPADINDILNQLKIQFYCKYALAKRYYNKAELIYVQRLFETMQEGNLVLQRSNFSEKARLNQEAEAYPLYENAIKVSHDLFKLTKESTYLLNMLKWSEASKVTSLKKAIVKRSKERKPGGISRIDEIEELEHVLHNTEYRIIELKRNYKPSDSIQMSNLKNSLVYYNSELETAKDQNVDELPRMLRPAKSDYPLAEVQAYLKSQSAVLLDYFWGDSVVVINVVNHDSIHSTIIKKKQNLDTDLEKYLALIKDPKSHNETVIQRLSDTLFQVLLAPVQNFMMANHLIIIPDGVLNLIPFELLLKNHGDHMDIRYEYS
ncbi:MAG: CHAT domain-containing protein, partial [Saprospiraceae bacterium]